MLNRKIGVLVLAFGLMSFFAPFAPAEAPATPRRPLVFTSADKLKANEVYFHNALTESYKSIGLHDPKWDGAAIEVLDAAARVSAASVVPRFYRPDSLPTNEERVALGKKAYDAACRDPLVMAEYAAALRAVAKTTQRPGTPVAPPPQEYVRVRDAAIDSLGDSKYPAVIVAVILDALAADCGAATQALVGQKVVAKLLDAACEKPRPTNREEVLNSTWTRLPKMTMRRGYIAALSRRPGADPWLLKMMQGRVEIDDAWESRGNGWAQQVTPEGWKGFHEHLKKARDLLVEAHEMDPSLPDAAAEMIKVTMGDGETLNEKLTDWFDRSQEAQIDFGPSYTNAAWALRPRWGGSYEEMLQLGSRFLVKPRYDTELPWDYLMIVRDIGQDQGRPWGPLLQPEVYDTAVRIAEGYAGHFGLGERGVYYKSVHAAIAIKVAKYEDARKVIDELTSAHCSVSAAAFGQFDITDSPFRVSEVYARTGEHAKAVVEIGKLLNSNHEMDAFKLLDGIRQNMKPGNPELAYFNGVYLDVKFLSGEWVAMTLVPEAWSSVTHGDVAFLHARHSIELAGAAGQPKSAIWHGFARNFDASHPFEFQATLTFTEAIGESATAGILFYAPRTRVREHAYIDGADKKAGFAVGADAQALWDVKINPTMTVLAHVEDGKVTLFVDGKQVGDPHALGPDFKEAFYIGVGGIDAAPTKFTDLRMRRIITDSPASKPSE